MIMLFDDYVLLFDRSCEWPVKLGQHPLMDVKRHYWCFEPALASRNILTWIIWCRNILERENFERLLSFSFSSVE